MAVRHRRRADALTLQLGRENQDTSRPPVCRGASGRRHQQPSHRVGQGATRLARDAARDRRGTDAVVGAAHPPHRRPHRDALPRLRLARVPRVLPRLAGPGTGDARRGGGDHLVRGMLLARVGLRHQQPRSGGASSSTRSGWSSKTSCLVVGMPRGGREMQLDRPAHGGASKRCHKREGEVCGARQIALRRLKVARSAGPCREARRGRAARGERRARAAKPAGRRAQRHTYLTKRFRRARGRRQPRQIRKIVQFLDRDRP